MVPKYTWAVVALLASSASALNRALFRPAPPRIEADVSMSALLAANNSGFFEFDQLIDHSNPSLGTFPQRIWWNSTFWAGPGSPVVLFTPGEIAAAEYVGFLGVNAITGVEAKAIGGATILMEHRYWGTSTPYAVQTTEAMQYLTLENSILDLTYFAQTVKLPFDPTGSSNAPKAPWVLVGGSYSGALTAWTYSLHPGTFWAYHASSAVVEVAYDFWQYFYEIQQGMPANCSADVNRVVRHVDRILTEGSEKEIHKLKDMFGFAALPHNDDFASALSGPLGAWQSTSRSTGYGSFYQFCDAIEGITDNSTTIPDKNGVGGPAALKNYAAYMKEQYVPGSCASYGYSDWTDINDVGCYDSYNKSSPFFTDLSSDNAADRPWEWFLCNEPFAYWQVGAPKGQVSLVSRLVTTEYYQRQCALFFPTEGNYTFGSAKGATTDEVNVRTKGWDLTDTKRLLWVNGEFDPWRSVTVSSKFRPGGPLASTPEAPIFLVKNGTHCEDFSIRSGLANAALAADQAAEVAQIKTWVDEFYDQPGKRSTYRYRNGAVRRSRIARLH